MWGGAALPSSTAPRASWTAEYISKGTGMARIACRDHSSGKPVRCVGTCDCCRGRRSACCGLGLRAGPVAGFAGLDRWTVTQPSSERRALSRPEDDDVEEEKDDADDADADADADADTG